MLQSAHLGDEVSAPFGNAAARKDRSTTVRLGTCSTTSRASCHYRRCCHPV